MQELEITWSRVMSIWWLIFWRGSIGALIIGFVLGFIVGFIFAMLGIALNPLVPGMLGGVVGLIWFVLVVRMALRKRYQRFRLALLPLA